MTRLEWQFFKHMLIDLCGYDDIKKKRKLNINIFN